MLHDFAVFVLSYSDLDKLGDIDKATEILEEHNYYPFGLKHRGYNEMVNATRQHKWRYNGIELDGGLTDFDLDVYSAKFRTLDPQTGRWWQIDPKAELFYDVSPYNSNNPIANADPEGDWWHIAVGAGIGGGAAAYYTWKKEGKLSMKVVAAGLGGAAAGAVAAWALPIVLKQIGKEFTKGAIRWGIKRGAEAVVGSLAGATGNFVQQRTNIHTGQQTTFNSDEFIASGFSGMVSTWGGQFLSNSIGTALVKNLTIPYGGGNPALFKEFKLPFSVPSRITAESVKQNILNSEALFQRALERMGVTIGAYLISPFKTFLNKTIKGEILPKTSVAPAQKAGIPVVYPPSMLMPPTTPKFEMRKPIKIGDFWH